MTTNQRRSEDVNILGLPLQPCGVDPITGFFRDGSCATGPEDHGSHTVCVRVDADFLRYSQTVGNDLSTPVPEYGFEGLKPGDRWCLCAARWRQALDANCAPRLYALATHQRALEVAELSVFKAFALDLS